LGKLSPFLLGCFGVLSLASILVFRPCVIVSAHRHRHGGGGIGGSTSLENEGEGQVAAPAPAAPWEMRDKNEAIAKNC
jgi:hypothetical protein